MGNYILRRVAQALLTLLVMSVVIFLLGFITGDPSQLLIPMDSVSEKDAALLREFWGLDKALHVQYWLFVSNAVRGDLGVSYVGARKISEMISQPLANTMKLCTLAMLMALVVSIPLGVVAAAKKDRVVDFGARLLAVLGQSSPSFLIALILMDVFAVRLGWLPTSGTGGVAHYVLPAATLAWLTTAGIVRLLRSGMLESLDSDYIKLARVKGLSEPMVIWKHALRNALIPVVTFAGTQFAVMITAAVVVETIFAWQGIGRLAYEAILRRDFPLLRGVILAVSVIVLVVNLLVDILCAYIDPRIELWEKS